MKKALSIFLALLMLCSTGTLAFAADESEIIAQGTCGVTVNWKLDSNGQMTIYGSGSMQNYWYTEDRRPPYETYKDQVTSLVIEEGITAIGKYAFYNFKNLTEKLVFPNSLKSIWDCAFEGCNGLTEAPQFNNTLTDIGFAAFRSCKKMKGDLVIPDSVTNLGSQMMPLGMLTVLDSILNRITANRKSGRETYIFIDEIYLLFQHEYSANFLFTLWKRVRKYGAYCTGITQNVDDLLQSHTARTMLANSEFIIMLNQGSTDREELAKLLQISDDQMKHITNVESGHGLVKVGSDLVPFERKFPKDTKLYKLMTTKLNET